MPLTQNIQIKKTQSALALRLEDAMFRWICTQNNNGVMLNGDLVMMQAKKPSVETNKLLKTGNHIKLKFSNR